MSTQGPSTMPQSIGREFMVKTQHGYLEASDQQKRIRQPPPVDRFDPADPKIELPPPDETRLSPVDFQELVTRRASLRQYADTAVSLADLSLLLWCTQGIKEVLPGRATLRTVPSAGARHAFETLLDVHRVEGLEAGLYQYDAIDHQLVRLAADANLSHRITAACYDQRFVGASAVTFLWVAVPYRMTWRYGERGYRYLLLDAGHVCQNLYLGAEAIGGGVCAVAAYDDQALNALLGLDGISRFVIYLAAVGKREYSGKRA